LADNKLYPFLRYIFLVCGKQTKSNANEVRVMLKLLRKDAAAETEAAVQEAKLILNREWEAKSRASVRSLNVHWVFTESSLDVHWMFIEPWVGGKVESIGACGSVPKCQFCVFLIHEMSSTVCRILSQDRLLGSTYWLWEWGLKKKGRKKERRKDGRKEGATLFECDMRWLQHTSQPAPRLSENETKRWWAWLISSSFSFVFYFLPFPFCFWYFPLHWLLSVPFCAFSIYFLALTFVYPQVHNYDTYQFRGKDKPIKEEEEQIQTLTKAYKP
jgi:hypothetical protein